MVKKQFKRIIALGISLALLLTSLICANAEVNLTASGTIEDADIIFEPSTVSTGSLGWVENTSDVNNILTPSDYGVQANGLYKFVGDNRNGDWQSMFIYDETSGELKYNKIYPPGVKYPVAYKVDTSAYSGISKITSYSGKLYSTNNFASNDADAAIVVNYIDNGNFDYVFPYIEGNNLWARTYSVRTETVTVGEVSYKKIYGGYNSDTIFMRFEQHNNGEQFVLDTETVDGAEVSYIEFDVAYSDAGITITFKTGDYTATRTFANDYFLNYNVKNHYDFSNNTDIKSVASFGNYPLSAAKAVGVATVRSSASYISDVKVTFDYNKSVADLANDFRTNHKDILEKETATEADQAAIDAALADYNSIIAVAPGAESELATEKAKLDNLQGSIMDAAVNAYFDAHSAALVITADTVNKDNVASVIAASTAYKALSDAVKAGVLAKYNADNGASITDLGATLDAIAKAVYYDKDGALIYDDFSGNNADAWEHASYDSGIKYIKTRGEKPIASVTYNLEIKVPESGKDFKNQLMYYYDNPARGAFYVGYDGSGKLFLQRGVCVSLNGNYSMMNTPIWLSEVKGRDVVHLTVKFGYDYDPFYAEASKLPYGNIEYAAKYIKVSLEATVEETQETFNSSYNSVYPNQDGPELTDVFTVGMNSIDPENELQVASIEIAYAKSADEFRAEYAETLALTTATVTVDDTKAVLDAKEALDGLTNVVKAQLNKEVIHLTRLYNKILELKTLDTVYLSATGDDANDGTQNSPVATLDKAYQWVRDGGTISIVGTYTLASDFVWNNHGKIVTISGGTLNGAALSKGLVLGEDVTFENITLEFDANDYIYANGHKLVMGENVVITNAINLFGGGVSGTTVESTDLTVLSGSYVAIYGGSNSGDVTGDTNLYIGGNVNSAICTALNHENVSNFYGGGYGGTVGGSTNIVFTDNALSSFVVGGGSGSNVVEGDTNVEFSGNASSYGIYGGTNDGSTVNGDINIVMKGGSVADLFGASGGTSYTGNVNIQLLGGNVVRRVYGGCYNGVGRSGLSIAWDSSYYVNGNITLFLSSNANVSMDGIDSQTGSKYDDRSLYVRSRQYTLSSNEKTYLIYADKAAYDKYKDKTGPQDDTMTRIMKNSIFGGFGTVRSASDNVYYCTYSANGSVITQKFNNVSVTENRADGTLEVLFDSDVSSLYTGSPIEAAKIVKNSTWVGPIPEIVYSNNTAVGTATASITSNGSTASTTFQITEDLTPAILGASISKSESQDIRFSCQFALTDKKVKEYGILITYYNRITKGYVTLEDLTVDSDNAYVIKGIATLETPASKSGQMFYANIGQVPPTSYGYRYVARIFVKYEGDDTYYYSDGGNGSIESATGVENGYICRSVISIAKSILSWTYDNYEKMDDEYGVGEITEIISGKNDNGKYVWASGVTANNGEKVLAYLNENAEALSRAISAIKQ